jgi:diacylglycerol kinase family enzyme
VEIFKSNGHDVTVAPTTGPGTAGGIVREHIAHGADLVVVAGGDGTINETAEGMVFSKVPLGILPGGTANVLAMEMKLGSRLERAAERLEECRPRRISLGRVTCGGGPSRHFLLMAGVGLDAHIVYHVNLPLKACAGKLAYWVAGGSLLGHRLPQIRVDSDGRQHECSFALLTKVKNYGGDFEIAREVTLFQDRFEMILFEGESSTRYVKYLAGMAFQRLKGMQGVKMLRTASATLSCPADRPVFIQIDGESAGYLPAEVSIVPDALTLLVPPGYGE